MRLYFNKYGLNQDLDVGNWKYKIPTPHPKKWSLYANIFQARGLPSGDSDATSDPYIIVYCDGKENKCQTKEDTLNPIWYENFAIDVEFDDVEDAPPIIVSVFDYDGMSKDDLLGLVVVNMRDAAINIAELAKPKWYKLSMGTTGSEAGEVLLSFNLLPKNQQLMLPPTGLRPQMGPVQLEFKILGLRALQSTGIFPVRKAFIKFDLNSLVFPGEEFSGNKNVITKPKEVGPNPNLNTVIKLDVTLPIDPLYWPTLSCTVFDQLFKGLSQPQLGIFNIPLEDVLAPKKDPEDEELDGNEAAKDRENSIIEDLPSQFNSSREEEKLAEPTDKVSALQVQAPKKWSQKGYEPLIETQEQKEAPNKVQDLGLGKDVKKRLAFEIGVQKKSTQKMDSGLTRADAREGKFVVKPQYETTPEGHVTEWNVPDPRFYTELGYDRKPGSAEKHYRYTLKKELEQSIFMDKTPFNVYDIWRGQNRGASDNWLNKIRGVESTLKKVGQFKGVLKVAGDKYTSEEDKNEDQSLSLIAKKEKQKIIEEIDKALLNKNTVLVRLYVLDCQNLMAMDNDSNSDPYLIIKLGKNKINDSQNYQEDEPNPKIFKVYDFETDLPGPCQLKIQAWDHDTLFSDELIGQTIIDLEDRFFSPKWRRLKEKPIETRQLFHKSSNICVGTIRIWLEIYPKSTKTREMILWDITPRPPAKFDARLVVWKTVNVANVDIEGTTDMYIRAFVNSEKAQETDTHLRCQNGKGSFNWRMIWPITLPLPAYRLTIQIWDLDVFSFNDFIAEATLDWTDVGQKAFAFNARTKKTGLYTEPGVWRKFGMKREENSEKFWIGCKRRNEKKQLEDGGEVLISFELVPEEKAKAVPVGKGRDEPNADPYLPAPVGRLELTLNPFKMISQLCGPEFRAKICCAICCALCITACVFLFPMIVGSVFGAIIAAPFT